MSQRSSQRVNEAMHALDYHPDQVARSLKTGTTNVIGIIVPDITNPFYTEITRGVEEEAEKNGYSVILCDSNEDPVREQDHLTRLHMRRVDGVLLASSVSLAAYDHFLRRRFPIVFVDAIPSGIREGVLTVDNVAGAYEATRHLIELGHRRIAIITGSLTRSVAVDRLEGYRMAMREADLLIPEQHTQQGDFHPESGYRCGLQLMQLSAPPTAIFSCNNRMTLGLMRALSELRVQCPARVSVVSFDDVDWASSLTPKLTCVAQPTNQMGRRATQMLLRRMNVLGGDAKTSDETIVKLKAELRIRESTGPPPPAPTAFSASTTPTPWGA